jgi:hypothetical protein
MSSSERSRYRVVFGGLWRGCLGGIVLALAFFASSGAAYLLLGMTSLPPSLTWLISIAIGPILGIAGLVVLLIWAGCRNSP